MTVLVTEATVDPSEVGHILEPRRGLVRERPVGDDGCTFEAVEGPVQEYRRAVAVEGPPDGRRRVRQRVEYRFDLPYFGWLLGPALRRHLRPLVARTSPPWWAPPDRLDPHTAQTLAALCALSVVAGYLGTLLTQTITFAADEFGATKADQGVALAVVRTDVVITVALMAMADRRGRRPAVLFSGAVGCALTATGALVPSLPFLAASQVAARGFVTATVVLLAVIAAEEMPAGSRAYGVSLLAMSAALGAGVCVFLLPIADLGRTAWRLLFAAALLGLPIVRGIAGRLPETKRFQRPHVAAPVAGHGRRFWLLALSGFLLNLFIAPASQFGNEYLRTERGFSAGRISLFTILTATPGGIGILVGGRLAERGRRLVGAVAVVGGVGATVLMYLSTGWPLWAWSFVGSIVGSATIPALGVYGPELFPTSLRGKSNGVITGVARLGSVVGLLVAGFLSTALGGLGPAMAVLSLGPAALAVLVLVAYPETAHRELEELNPEDALPAPDG
ncbi:MAG: MFS transporter [Actinomycetota bacterium]|nr:MFS transporter [Actinomycetota bacterium]